MPPEALTAGALLRAFPPVLSSSEMREADRLTSAQLGVSSEILMARAGKAAFDQICARYPDARSFLVLVGKGNNGGDGIIVAEHALERGFKCGIHALFGTEGHRLKLDEFRARRGAVLEQSEALEWIQDVDVVVDAIFGIHYREGDSVLAPYVAALNRFDRRPSVVALDLPSGVVCDTGVVRSAIRADVTVTFQALKLLHLLHPGAEYSGERVVVDIGVHVQSWSSALVWGEHLTRLLQGNGRSPEAAHKGRRGHVSVVGGSAGHSGAALLASRAALRGGAGLVTLFSDVETNRASLQATPEVMTELVEEGRDFSEKLADTVVIGPGMSDSEKILEVALCGHRRVVLDATGIRIFARASAVQQSLRGRGVMTPHPGELAELLGVSVSEIQAARCSFAREAAKRFHCAVLLKGAYTVIAFPEGELFFLPFSHANLGTAGSGDVLAGLIGALLARFESLPLAVLTAAYVHGYAGSLNLPKGCVGELASEFGERFPYLYEQLLSDRLPKIDLGLQYV